MAIQLTDQALVAVEIARRLAARRSSPASVLDLLIGLAAEPDGDAGRELRQRASAVTALAGRPQTPRLAPLDVALRWAAADAAARPAGTAHLLAAALEAGGEELADVLAAAGLEELGVPDPDSAVGDGWHETRGLRSLTDRLEPAADLAVARVRGRGGGAVELLVALAELVPDPLTAGSALPGDEQLLLAAQHRLGAAEDHGPGWDEGVDSVLRAARRLWPGRRADAADLVAAASIAGGAGPARLLDEAAALAVRSS